MKFFILIAVMLAVSAPATGANPKLTKRIAETQAATWKCQDRNDVKRTEVSVSPWGLPKSQKYRKWVLALWESRFRACQHQLELYESVVGQLESGLLNFYRRAGAGSTGPLSGSGWALERTGRKYGVSPFFIAAVSITESSGGLAACSNNRFNVWGLSSCNSGWYVPPFSSWAEAFDFYARFLTGRTSVTGGWPNARTTYDYHGYAACSSCWGRKTAEHMFRWFGVDNQVRYP